ncbi:MAG TPA: MCE family protein [Streptosporangiaceae bacterium]|nr:MCE family protein [Streptosporangiaceae bacterium]
MRRLMPVAAGLVALAVAGCSSSGFNGIYSITLPGGANLGSHPYKVTAQFTNALNLVPQSAVKVDDVTVGRVIGISLPPHGWRANVTMEINGSIRLPSNAIAELTQSSLLGEEYVALAPPPGAAGTGRLGNGAVIPVYRTTSDVTVEEVLGALSLLLNGGGIGQIHTITTELNAALDGHTAQVHQLLGRLTELVANLNTHRGDIVTALRGINNLAARLAKRDGQITFVLRNLRPGLRVLAEQRSQLVALLDSLHELSTEAVTTIAASKRNIVADLRLLKPTLGELAAAGRSLPLALQVLLTFPFTNRVLGDIKGDYLNAYLSIKAPPGTTVIPPIKQPKGTP